MEHLKGLGILAVIIFVVPFVWQGAGSLHLLYEAAGPVCIINGSEGRRVAQVISDGVYYQLRPGGFSTCALEQNVSNNGVPWEVDGEEYTMQSSYAGGDPWPDPYWQWPFTMTWDADGMETLAVEGWRGQLYSVFIPLLPAAIMVTFLGLTLFVWVEPQD